MSPETGVPADRYRRFVQPGHELLDAVFGPRHDRAAEAPVAVLERALESLRRRTVYRSQPGHASFDELLAGWRDRDVPLVLNCINQVCLLVSFLRRAGVPADHVHVALAGMRGLQQHHAWTLLRHGDSFLWIDPARLEPERWTGEAVLEHHDLYVIYNDRDLLFSRAEKQSLLRSAPAPALAAGRAG